MPNGRHGAALIPRDDLNRFLDSISGDPIVGRIQGEDVVLSHAIRLAKSYREREVLVEGQDLDPLPGAAIVIHFGPKAWLWVGEEQGIYEDLMKFWLGWVGRS